MNILFFLDKCVNKLCHCCQAALFLLVKKPLYYLSYNSKGNHFSCKGLMFNTSVKLSGEANQIIVEKGARLENMKIVVSGRNNKLIIHKNVILREHCIVDLIDENNLLEIGEGTSIADGFFAVKDYNCKVIVGQDCVFSAKVVIRTSDAHSILDSNGLRINPGQDTIIGDRVWICRGATILKGSRIGCDSVIAAESVVAGLTVPDGCVAAGNPAKVVKQGIHWDKRRL